MSEAKLFDSPGIGIQLGNDRIAAITDTDTGRACVEAIIKCEPLRVYELLTDYRNLPTHISGLRGASLIGQSNDSASVEFTMKLPFPIGTVRWTNTIKTHESDGSYRIAWTLVEGDLTECSGNIVMRPADDLGTTTRASYQIHVSQRSLLPKRAQRTAVNWLLPRVARRLFAKLESAV